MNEETHVSLTPVKSSQIVAVGYDADANTMSILFKNRDGSTGSLYQYDRIPPEVHAALVGAESVGSYFIRSIKPHADHYPYRKIDAARAQIVEPIEGATGNAASEYDGGQP